MAKKNTDGGPTPPKKPLTGFFLYKADVYEDTKKQYPDKKMTELTKVISEKWAKVDAATKANYDKKHAALKEKYIVEKEAFEEKHGKPEKKSRKGKGGGGKKKKGSESDDDDDGSDEEEKPAKKSRGAKKK